jgi:phage-related protein
MVATFIESGSVQLFFGVVGTAIELLVKFLSLPGVSQMLLLGAAMHGLRLGVGRVAKGFETVGKYVAGDYFQFKKLTATSKTAFANIRTMAATTFGKIRSVASSAFSAVSKGAKAAFDVAKTGATAAATQMKAFGSAIKNSTVVTKLAGAATKVWTGIQAAFNAVMAMNPIALIVIGIIALIAAIVLAYKKFESFRNFVNAVFGGLRDIVMTVVNAIIGAFKWLYNVLIGNSIIPDIIDGIIFFFQKAYDFIKVIVDFIVEVFRVAFDVISAVVKFAWDNIIKPIFEAFGTVFSLVWDGIKLYYETVWAIITTGVKFAWNNIIKPIFQAFGTVFSSVWGGIKSAFKTVWDYIIGAIAAAKSIFGGVGSAIKDAFKAAFNFVADAWNGTLGKIGFTAPKWLGGWSFKIPTIPRLAEGGIVMPSTGGTLARIGEAGQPERVEPLDPDGLSKRDKAMIKMMTGGAAGGVTINVHPSPGMDEVELASLVSRQLAFQLRAGSV